MKYYACDILFQIEEGNPSPPLPNPRGNLALHRKEKERQALWFDTWEEAHARLLELALKQYVDARREVQYAAENVRRVKDLKKRKTDR